MVALFLSFACGAAALYFIGVAATAAAVKRLVEGAALCEHDDRTERYVDMDGPWRLFPDPDAVVPVGTRPAAPPILVRAAVTREKHRMMEFPGF